MRNREIPIICPMCNNDVEHMLHVFYDCNFIVHCRAHVNLICDMSGVEQAPTWLLQKLSEALT